MTADWGDQFKRALTTVAPVYRYIFIALSVEQAAAVMHLAERYWQDRQTKTIEGAIQRAVLELDPNHHWVRVPAEIVDEICDETEG